MKKFLVGCLVIVVLGGILFAIGGFLLYRAASPVLQDARNYLSRLAELGDLEKDIVNRSPHTPPATGELTEEQMQRFARVQDSTRKALGQRMTEIEAKYADLKKKTESGQQPSAGEIFSALGDIGNIFVQARRYQINALNQEGFSQAEYSWVRDRIFQAAGMEVTNMIDLKKLEDAVRNGTGIDNIGAPRVPTPNVPEKNRAIVKPYLERMDDWIPLAFFGL
jgi:hypothetical protein